MAAKTNAARLLDTLGISYSLHTYDVDPDDLSASAVAAKVGLSVEQVYKTLVVRGDRHGPCFAVLPGDHDLDLRALARITGDRRIETVRVGELPGLTGYVRGGVTVLSARRAFPVVVDDLVELHEIISVSAGQRGVQIWLAPADYLRATGAQLADIARPRA
ncbi:MAG TPA: Cys-tRNA(Pro) deacylase [Deltaproteobacteria bacterium]|nr:Cys-tRNA(Pro) deacylase [Deltaproteobacteria bacterium]